MEENIKEEKIDVIMFNMSAYSEWQQGYVNRNSHILHEFLRDPRIRKIVAVDYLPFTSGNKFSAAIVKSKQDSRHFLNVLGAPEVLLRFSGLDRSEQNRILGEVNKMAQSGERVIGLAAKEIASPEGIILRQKHAFKDLEFMGTVSFRDPVRFGVKDAIEKVRIAGVRTVIVTGDHRGTAEWVGNQVGITFEDRNVIHGPELDEMSEEQLIARLPDLKLVSRVSPEGKMRIAQAFRSQGEVVAMTGDGINDAVSLKAADIGVAMGSGTDVARDVSDLRGG